MAHSVTSTGVYPTPPEIRALPPLTGDARLGRTLTCGSGDWDDSYAFTYEWLRDGRPTGATGTTLTLAAADVGNEVSCRVTAAGLAGAVSRTVVTPRPARADRRPRSPASPRVGQTLTCGRGTWDDPATPYAVTYAWFVGGAPVAGTQPTRTVAGGRRQHRLQCHRGGADDRRLGPGRRHERPGRQHRERDAAGAHRHPAPARHAHLRPGRLDQPRRVHLPLAARRRSQVADATRTYTVVAADLGRALRCEVTTRDVTASSAARDARGSGRRQRPRDQRRSARPPHAALRARHLGRTVRASPTSGCAERRCSAPRTRCVLSGADVGTLDHLPRQGRRR